MKHRNENRNESQYGEQDKKSAKDLLNEDLVT